MSEQMVSAAPAIPITVRVKEAVALSGLSRTTLYDEAAAGRLRMVKYGRTALVDMASLRSLLDGLPTKVVRGKAA